VGAIIGFVVLLSLGSFSGGALLEGLNAANGVLLLIGIAVAVVWMVWRLWRGRRALSARNLEKTVAGATPLACSDKILILSAAVGGGHEAAGRAVQTELEQAGHGVLMTDGLRAMSPLLNWLLCRGYRRQIQGVPGTFGAVYAVTSWRIVAKTVRAVVGLLYTNRLLYVVGREKPDLVISTYPLVTAALGRARANGRLRIPAMAVIADYGVHPLWVDPNVDLHLVVSRRSAELAERAGGVASLIRMPVDGAFLCAPGRYEARAVLGIPRESFVALVVGGVWGIGDLEGAARCAVESGACTLVVTGNNAGLKDRLEKRFAREENVKILGWRDDMPALMAAADCLIQNAGGMTCLEGIEMGLPIVFFCPILGHGELNALVMEQEGHARRVRDAEELRALLQSAASGDASLSAPQREARAPGIAASLETLAGTAPRPVASPRRKRHQLIFVVTTMLAVFVWSLFASAGMALAAKAFGFDVPGYNPSEREVALAVEVKDPVTATAVENMVQREGLPVTIFADARGAKGLHQAAGLVFGVAQTSSEGKFPAPWERREKTRTTAAAIQHATGTYPRYFLPASRTNLAALAYTPPHTRLVMAERSSNGGPRPGLLVVEASGPKTASSQLTQDLHQIRAEGLECVPLARL
jgi:UDP-N-acetylglucosamine:LPS N-acetylglucosamine transferase